MCKGFDMDAEGMQTSTAKMPGAKTPGAKTAAVNKPVAKATGAAKSANESGPSRRPPTLLAGALCGSSQPSAGGHGAVSIGAARPFADKMSP